VLARFVLDTHPGGARRADGGANGQEEDSMEKVAEFYVDPDLCTECGDCIKAMPRAFRKVEDEELAEVYNTDLDESQLPMLQKIMTECPGHAILWKK
jgi:ferredoxin